MSELEKLPAVVYPDGSVTGSFGADTVLPESPEVLHRPHAFALIHGKRGAKVAYGELHYSVNSFKLKFETSAISVADHDDHSHAPHTTSSHTHNVEDHRHLCGDCGSGSGSGSGSGDYTGSMDGSVGTDSAGSETLTHSGVKDVGGSSTAPPAVLSHTVSGQITYCSGASQESLGNITQKVPNYPREDGDLMVANINDVKYHELEEYGDVYLCWKVDLENVGNEVTKCWVQVGEPDGDPVIALGMGNSTTNRRNENEPHTATGQPEGEEAGVYNVKLGTVIKGDPVRQYVSSDVVWQPTVLDREKV
tara:strand:- start:1541 stop:2458 length:918 start_codon:yes stop_codon:yes gene_type:complete